jgi:hypothetical protein
LVKTVSKVGDEISGITIPDNKLARDTAQSTVRVAVHTSGAIGKKVRALLPMPIVR